MRTNSGPDTWLFARLGLPLFVLFAASIWLHDLIDTDGFFLNLATEVIGIGITVAYVDRVLRRHEAAEWGSARSIIKDRIQLAANGGLTGIRSALGMSDLKGWSAAEEVLTDSRYRTLIRREVVPQLPMLITALPQAEWKRLADALNQVSTDADLILRLFGSRLRATEFSMLLEIQDCVRQALLTYTIVPNRYGSDLQVHSPADIVANEFDTNAAIKEVGAVIEKLLQLGDLVPDEPTESPDRRA